MFCKTIILSNSQNLTNNAPKGILTLSKESNAIKGKIRLYNVVSLPPLTKIGLYINEKVYISAINKKTNYYEFELKENIDITQSIYCALIDNSDNDKKVLLEGGSFNGFYFTDSPFDSVLEAKDEEIEQTIDEALKQSDKCETCNCENCEYKKYFYQNNNLASENIMEIKNKTNKSPLLDDLNTSGNRDLKTNDTATDTFQTNVIEKLEQEIKMLFEKISGKQRDKI